MLSVLAAPPAVVAADWPSWRGPAATGFSDETALPEKWSQDGENMVWCNKDVASRSTPIIMNGRLFITADCGKDATAAERVVCLDADTGKLIWEYVVPVFHTTIPATRVSWTSVVGDPETGAVYAHLTSGMMIGLDRDGKLLWRHSLTEEYYRISGYGGRLSNPIVDGDLVIANFLCASWGELAKGAHRYVAFDKRTGNVVWWLTAGEKPLDTPYSCPVVADMHGQRLLIGGTADGHLFAAKVQTGELVWKYPFCKLAVNVSPVVVGNRIYVTHGEENLDSTAMGRVACIETTGDAKSPVREVWRRDGIDFGYASPAIHDGRLISIDNGGVMHCFDAATGEPKWKHRVGRVGKGSPVIADGKIYCTEVNSRFVIARFDAAKCETLDDEKFPPIGDAVVDVYGSPAVANGRVYFATQAAVYCIGPKTAKPTPNKPFVKFETAPKDAPPAALAIYPADVMLHTGGKQSFAVRAFDAAGRFIREVDDDATWSGGGLPGPMKGGMDMEVGPKLGGTARVIAAEAFGLKATARVRTVRPIPFAENFDGLEAGKAPVDWVGALPKFTVDVIEGQHVLKKKADLPQLARGDVFLGSPEMSGYTIQCDVCATEKNKQLPDMGVTANRYRLELMGNQQKLRIVSWVPMPRIEVVMPFAFKAGEWYTLQLRVDIVGGASGSAAGGSGLAAGAKAIARGKAWKRGEPEPAEWTITLEDPLAQSEGSPGIYGFSLAEIYYDNVNVWKSK